MNAPDEEEIDDQFRSLMEGLRTSLPGVQVLFAFLLTAPLQSRFDDLSDGDRTAFSIAFFMSGMASLLLIAPSVHQRVRAPISGLRRHTKSHLIWATWVTITGSVCMGIAMMATVYLVSTMIHGRNLAFLATALMSTVLVWAWFYLPVVTFGRDRD